MDKRPICGVLMLRPGREQLEELTPAQRKRVGIFQVRCTKDPGHHGNHSCQTARAYFEWWNQADNLQRRTT
jgi:hypothetical protein